MSLMPPPVNGAAGIHGPVSLPAESGLGEEELPEPGGMPMETPDGRTKFLGMPWAGEVVGSRHRRSAAGRPASAVAGKAARVYWGVFSWVVSFESRLSLLS